MNEVSISWRGQSSTDWLIDNGRRGGCGLDLIITSRTGL